MGKVVNVEELKAWIDTHAVEVEEQPEPEVQPEPVAIKAGDKVVFKSGVTPVSYTHLRRYRLQVYPPRAV